MLLKVSGDIVKSNADMCKVSESINHQSTEAIKYIRRVGKRLLDAQERHNHEKDGDQTSGQGQLGLPAISQSEPQNRYVTPQYSSNFRSTQNDFPLVPSNGGGQSKSSMKAAMTEIQ